MTADLSTREVLSVATGLEAFAEAPRPATAQVLHRYGKIEISDLEPTAPMPEGPAAAPVPREAERAAETLTERLGLSAFGLRSSDRYAKDKAERPFKGRSWGSEEDDEGPSPIHIPDDDDTSNDPDIAGAPTAPLSQRMTGQIALGLVLVSGTEEHLVLSELEKTQVIAEVQNGLSFLASQSPAKDVTFVHEIHDLIATAAEVTDGSTYEDFEKPWRDDALAQLGFDPGFLGARAFAEDLRERLGTDWAYVAFFTKYRLKHFAYANIGGPKLVMHYKNDGWGPNNIDAVFAHETGHIFNAPDEYGGAKCNCEGSWGFFERPNANCASCAPGGGVRCLMRMNDFVMCESTPFHLGYKGLPGVEGNAAGV